ncbi:MAG TPA: hypothetical protein VHE35_36960 [Kofleriaceae bacterium]|nr:hypothetical protein [Kofleriaceae bacterium]
MTKRMTIVVALAVGLLGCSKLKKDTLMGGEGGSKGPLGDTMADAVKYDRGATITAPLLCHTSGYAKFPIPEGQAIHFDVTVASPKDEACIAIGFLKDTGGDAGISDEVCSTAPKSYDVTAPAGKASFLQLSENGVCQGASVTIAIK